MSLIVSTNAQGASFAASSVPVQLLSVADVSTNLGNTFWTLEVIDQRNTLHSACHYLEAIEGTDAQFLTGIREEMIPELETRTEPSATDRLKLARLIAVWSSNRRAVQSKFPAPAGESDGAMAPEPSAEATPVPAPPTPLPPSSPRLGNPLFAAPPPPAIPLEAKEESAEDNHLYPSVWWRFAKETRLGLKQIALSGGSVKAHFQDDASHVQFLLSAVQTWLDQAKEALVEETKTRKERVSDTVVRKVMDCLAMSSDVMEYFRKEEGQVSDLGRMFWKGLCEKSAVRLTLSRLLMRDVQAQANDDIKNLLQRINGHVELGIVEAIIMPLFEGQLSANPSDESQGSAAALEMSKHLGVLPMSARTDLNAEQIAALNDIEIVLRTVAHKMRGDPQSVYASAFVRALSADVMRLTAITEMMAGIRR